MTIILRHSKTEPFEMRVTLYMDRTGCNLCLVVAVLAYLAICPLFSGQLFMHSNGSPLSQTDLTKAVHNALVYSSVDTSGYSNHSFCIGTISMVVQAGLLDFLIQTLGHWRLSSFLAYIRTSPQQLLSIFQSLTASSQCTSIQTFS